MVCPCDSRNKDTPVLRGELRHPTSLEDGLAFALSDSSYTTLPSTQYIPLGGNQYQRIFSI